MKWFLVFLALTPSLVQAKEVVGYVDIGGAPIWKSREQSNFNLSTGVIHPLLGFVKGKVLVGALKDTSQSLGNESFFFGAYQVGVDISLFSWLNLGAFSGPGVVTNTDQRLSTTLQFFTEGRVRFTDGHLFYDVGYRHVSNADLKRPNEGRDMLFVGLGFPW